MQATKMPAEQKGKVIDELAALLQECDMAVLTEYRGLSTPELRRLRLALRPHNAEYHVTKNTLLRIAAKRAGKEAMVDAMVGPTAVAFVRGELAEPVKVLTDFVRSTRNVLVIKGGLLGDKPMTAADVTEIAELPPRDQLIAQVVGQMQAPIAGLVYVLNNPVQALAYTLQARVEQMGGEAAA